jgi:hypothetical protein
MAVTPASPDVRPATTCAWADAASNHPSDIAHHRHPASVFTAFPFPGVGLPDAGFLAAMFACAVAGCPCD